jgi:hypothetical protein
MTRNQLKETLKNIMQEESAYAEFFKKALEKAGKSIPSMSDEEKKEFFNKIDAAWGGKGEKNEELVGNQHKLDIDGDGEIEASDLAALRAGKKKDESVNDVKEITANTSKLFNWFWDASPAKDIAKRVSQLNDKDLLSLYDAAEDLKRNGRLRNPRQIQLALLKKEIDRRGLSESVNDVKEITANTSKLFNWFWDASPAKDIAKRVSQLNDKDLLSLYDAAEDLKRNGRLRNPRQIQLALLKKEIDRRGLSESVNEAFSDNKNLNYIMKGRKVTNVAYDSDFGFAVILDNGKYVLFNAHSARPGQSKDMEFESVNEITFAQGLKALLKGNTSSVEGIKVSPELANAIASWSTNSIWGQRYGSQLMKAPFANAWKMIFSSAYGVESHLKRFDKVTLAKVKPELAKIQAKLGM